MHTYLKAINSLVEKTGKIFSYLLYFGIILLFVEVILRYVFNAPTVWAHGYSQRIFGSYFILIGGFTLLRGGHVRVDLIYKSFSFRARAFFDMLTYCFLLFWSFILISEGWNYFMRSFMIRQTDDMVLAHPIYPIKFILVIGAILIFLQGLNFFIIQLISFIRGEQYEL